MSQFQNLPRRDDPLMHTAEFAAYTSVDRPRSEAPLQPVEPLPFSKGLWWVALGGALGALSRYALSVFLPTTTTLTLVDLPWATFMANVLGCGILGVLNGVIDVRPLKKPWINLVLGTGFCGGFTTMSTFSAEVSAMLGARFPIEAFQYILGTLVTCLLAIVLGYLVGRGFMRTRLKDGPMPGAVVVEEEDQTAAQIRSAVEAAKLEGSAIKPELDALQDVDGDLTVSTKEDAQ